MTTAEARLAELLGALDHPMFILTVQARGERSGCLVGFATQTSIHPPRFLVCVSRTNHTFEPAMAAEHVAVHLAPDDDDLGLARLFGEETGDRVDKFARCRWHDGPEGQPILDHAPAWFVGRVTAHLSVGDHVGLLLAPVAVAGEAEEVLTFGRARHLDAGHEA